MGLDGGREAGREEEHGHGVSSAKKEGGRGKAL